MLLFSRFDDMSGAAIWIKFPQSFGFNGQTKSLLISKELSRGGHLHHTRLWRFVQNAHPAFLRPVVLGPRPKSFLRQANCSKGVVQSQVGT